MSTDVPVAAETARHSTIDLAPQFPVLDSLRAVGALAVLTTHTSFQAGSYTGHGVWGTLLSRLDVGVAIFFVLSGFLLSRPHIARAAAGAPPPSTGRYYWKRFIRIYPVYVVTVVIALLAIPENDGIGGGGWLRSLLMLDVYADEGLPHALTQMWSLAVEVSFYALLPLLMWVALGPRRAPDGRRLAVLSGLLVAFSVVWHLGGADAAGRLIPGSPLNWLPAFFTWFVVGILLAHAHVVVDLHGPRTRLLEVVTSLGALPGTCWAMAGALMLVAATPLAGPTLLYLPSSYESLTKNLLYAMVGGLVVLTGVFGAAGRYTRLMSSRPLRHLGHISYSLFCIHLVLLALAWEITGFELFAGHGLEIWALTLAMSLIASELLYRLVEMPGMRLKNLRVNRNRRRFVSSATQVSSATHTETTR